MEYRWKINLTGTLPDGHTPDLTITRINDGVRNLPTREMLEETSRSLARSSTELVGERISKFFGKK